MTWKSHIAIATAVTMPFAPAAIPAAALGATAPDWTEWILKFFGLNVEHRGFTHYLYIPLLIILFSFLFDFRGLIFWFGVGYLTHWFADSLTITGVPISKNSSYRVHFFGGKIRTGDKAEYLISFGLLLISFLITKPLNNFENKDNFNPYMMNYKKLNEEHIIDNKTYQLNRFKLF